MILFEHNASSFSSQGLGTLYDVMNDVVVEEINGMLSLEFDYPITGDMFKEIRFRRIVYCKPNPFVTPEPFRITSISTPINGIVTILADHISYDTSGYPMDPFSVNSVSELVNKLNTSKIINHNFTFSTNISDSNKLIIEQPISIRNLLGGPVIEVFKPEYSYNLFHTSLLTKRGSVTDYVIRYGVNLVDYVQEENISNLYTEVYPYWTNHGNSDVPILKTLPEKTVKTPGTWNFSRALILDLSSEFDEIPSDVDMRKETLAYIDRNNIGIPSVSMTVSFIHLDESSIMLGDTVVVDFVLGNIKTVSRCVKTSYSPTLDRYISIDLGKIEGNIANTIVSGFADTSKKMNETKTYIDNSINNSIGTTTNASSLTTGSLRSTNRNFTLNIDDGSFSLGGINGTIKHDDVKSVYKHTTGEISELGAGGFKIDSRPYLSLINKGSVNITDQVTNTIDIILPESFRNKTFEVILSVEDTNNTTNNPIDNMKLTVVNKDYVRGKFTVEGYITTTEIDDSVVPPNKVTTKTPIKFNYMAIGG